MVQTVKHNKTRNCVFLGKQDEGIEEPENIALCARLAIMASLDIESSIQSSKLSFQAQWLLATSSSHFVAVSFKDINQQLTIY